MGGVVALAGNPNSGKTTLFNAITGANQYVGNWPGVTVERKEAQFLIGEREATLVDLPGAYSLAPYSIEERVTLDFLTRGAPDVILNIVDATNLARNLYLTMQLMELGRPMVVVLNLMDEFSRRGGLVDCKALSTLLGAPVVPISAKKRKGFDAMFHAIYQQMQTPVRPLARYDAVTMDAVAQIRPWLKPGAPAMWTAMALLEGEESSEVLPEHGKNVARLTQRYAAGRGTDGLIQVAKARYAAIERALQGAGYRSPLEDSTRSDKIDRIVTHKYLAFPIFFGVLAAIFALTFGAPGTFFSNCMERLVQKIAQAILRGMSVAGAPEWAASMLSDGVVAGVGGVVAFLPQILMIFLCMSLLEDSGYMARAAYIADRMLRGLGLSGRSFIPLLMGFGCTTTAVMAARGVENQRDRRMTILLTPFMSCGAKLPVYALFTSALFPKGRWAVVLALYMLGMGMMSVCGVLLRKTVFRRGETPFVMELPEYRMPDPRSVMRRMWDRTRDFLTRAGTLIFAMSVLIWFLRSLSPTLAWVSDPGDSIFALLGMGIAPLLRPLGFGQWQKAVALLSGVVAKEAVVSTLQVLYSAGDVAALTGEIAARFSPLSACSFLVFTLLYTPCVSALAAMRRELGLRRYVYLAVAMQTGVAYGCSLLVYQIGRLFCGGLREMAWIGYVLAILTVGAAAWLIVRRLWRFFRKEDGCARCPYAGVCTGHRREKTPAK